MVAASRRKSLTMKPTLTGKLGTARRSAKRRTFWGRISLARGSRASGRVSEKKRVIRMSLVALMQILFDLPVGVLSESERESLAACLPLYNEQCGPGEQLMQIRTRKWVVSKMWTSMHGETNQKICGDVILMAAQFYLERRDWIITEPVHELAKQCLFNVLRCENQRRDVLICAFDMQYAPFDTDVEENCLLGARIWLRLIGKHRAPYAHIDRMLREAARFVERCLWAGTSECWTSVVDLLLASDLTLPFLVAEIGRASEKKQGPCEYQNLAWVLSDLLTTLLLLASDEQRAALLDRYGAELRNTFHLMAVCHIVILVHPPEIRTIFRETPSLIAAVWSRVKHECEGSWSREYDPPLADETTSREQQCPHDEGSLFILRALEDALQDGQKLQRMLGLGMLGIASHFALNEFDRSTTYKAMIFRQILARYPCWTRHYKDLTQNGIDGNAVADLGKQLAYRVRAPREYIMEEDVENI